MLTCIIPDCDKEVKHVTKCKKHWLQIKKHGKPVKTAYDPRPARVDDSIAYIPLGLNAYNGYATVDKQFSYLCRYKWNKSDTGYARALIDGKWHKLHRLVMGAPKGLQVDHINGDRLDNRKNNLRICDNGQNARNRDKQKNNTTGYKGVYKRGLRYCAKLVVDGKQHHLGTYDTPKEAATAYNNGALKLFGEFAKLNKTES